MAYDQNARRRLVCLIFLCCSFPFLSLVPLPHCCRVFHAYCGASSYASSISSSSCVFVLRILTSRLTMMYPIHCHCRLFFVCAFSSSFWPISHSFVVLYPHQVDSDTLPFSSRPSYPSLTCRDCPLCTAPRWDGWNRPTSQRLFALRDRPTPA